jgi:hypothetical protein
MKSFVIYTLLFAILMQAVGCMSFYPLEKNESIKDYLKPDNRLEFRLKNGNYIKASSEACVFIVILGIASSFSLGNLNAGSAYR